MGELSIKIRIADREYPMKVSPAEEERLRIAGRMINEKLKTFKDNFGIDDKQDLLAMVAFDSVVEQLRTEHLTNDTTDSIAERIDQLNALINKAKQS